MPREANAASIPAKKAGKPFKVAAPAAYAKNPVPMPTTTSSSTPPDENDTITTDSAPRWTRLSSKQLSQRKKTKKNKPGLKPKHKAQNTAQAAVEHATPTVPSLTDSDLAFFSLPIRMKVTAALRKGRQVPPHLIRKMQKEVGAPSSPEATDTSDSSPDEDSDASDMSESSDRTLTSDDDKPAPRATNSAFSSSKYGAFTPSLSSQARPKASAPKASTPKHVSKLPKRSASALQSAAPSLSATIRQTRSSGPVDDIGPDALPTRTRRTYAITTMSEMLHPAAEQQTAKRTPAKKTKATTKKRAYKLKRTGTEAGKNPKKRKEPAAASSDDDSSDGVYSFEDKPVTVKSKYKSAPSSWFGRRSKKRKLAEAAVDKADSRMDADEPKQKKHYEDDETEEEEQEEEQEAEEVEENEEGDEEVVAEAEEGAEAASDEDVDEDGEEMDAVGDQEEAEEDSGAHEEEEEVEREDDAEEAEEASGGEASGDENGDNDEGDEENGEDQEEDQELEEEEDEEGADAAYIDGHLDPADHASGVTADYYRIQPRRSNRATAGKVPVDESDEDSDGNKKAPKRRRSRAPRPPTFVPKPVPGPAPHTSIRRAEYAPTPSAIEETLPADLLNVTLPDQPQFDDAPWVDLATPHPLVELFEYDKSEFMVKIGPIVAGTEVSFNYIKPLYTIFIRLSFPHHIYPAVVPDSLLPQLIGKPKDLCFRVRVPLYSHLKKVVGARHGDFLLITAHKVVFPI